MKNLNQFKSTIKSLFPSDKISFKSKGNGTAFGVDGEIYIASIKKDWSYEIPNNIYSQLVKLGCTTGSVNNIVKVNFINN
ncbi:hypothetical protein [Pedobacter punctiformis]|uniref:Uncharacterized protein n=1 Tax=Pedobacter punctiformis TaxID=3004097 RepID=A0ABT4LAM7_9SPHI|nr:hypothetical protein [Pedobacter sp. HCMS5-2]MCZ4244960.1 hypothetical protein [Pedobacter sp. HCMS5-2]